MSAPTLRSRPAGPPVEAIHTADGMGRSAGPRAGRTSDDLRRHADLFLDRRRRVVGLSLVAVGAMTAVSAYQAGLVRHLPEPPLPIFDADRVDAAPEAYQFLRTPDGLLGVVSYGITAALAATGPRTRAEDAPWVVLALGAKVAVDALAAVALTVEQGSVHRRFCSWCLLASAASLAAVPAVLPESRAALRSLRRRRP